MTVFEAIKRRRSIGKMTQQRPTREQIERLLEAATHAPNHHKVEPWKFFVLAGKAREELGVVMAESLAVRLGDVGASSVPGSDPTALAIASGTQWSRHTLPSSARFIASLGGGEASSNKAQALLNKERNKLLRAPVVIAVAAEQPHLPKVMEIENIEAVAAAVQNMLLTAEELGLACMWRTGDAAYDPQVKHWLGLAAEEHLVAFVYLGFPAVSRVERFPTPFEKKTMWLGWEE